VSKERRDELEAPADGSNPLVSERDLLYEVVCPECLPRTYLCRSRYKPTSSMVSHSHNERLGHHSEVHDRGAGQP
jgi:hypothetical protein